VPKGSRPSQRAGHHTSQGSHLKKACSPELLGFENTNPQLQFDHLQSDRGEIKEGKEGEDMQGEGERSAAHLSVARAPPGSS
jgi:hypothetical protein